MRSGLAELIVWAALFLKSPPSQSENLDRSRVLIPLAIIRLKMAEVPNERLAVQGPSLDVVKQAARNQDFKRV